MLSIIQNIPNINTYPLTYIFENMKLKHKQNTLWLEFGVASGNTINYISKFTNDKVYGFDSFEGVPEKWRDGFDKGAFNRNGGYGGGGNRAGGGGGGNYGGGSGWRRRGSTR